MEGGRKNAAITALPAMLRSRFYRVPFQVFLIRTAVRRDECARSEDIAPHRRLDSTLGRARRQIQLGIERIKAENITMSGPEGRTRSVIADVA
jgi:hypothetical protein